ncbi:hypothetical protein Tco_1448006 [Tanacetum coccineum]
MKGHYVSVDVHVIRRTNTVCPTFDPVSIWARITNWPRSVMISRVPLHRPWLGFTFRKSIIGSPFFRTSVEALQTSSALLYVIVGPGNLSNIYAFIASASSFLGVRIARSFRYAPSLYLVEKSRNVSFTICSIGDSIALIMKSFGI